MEHITGFIHNFVKQLSLKYNIKDLGPRRYYLVWTIHINNNHTTHISKPDLIDKAVDRVGLTQATTRSSPLPHLPNFDDACAKSSLSPDQHQLYTSLFGDLWYLEDSTRLEISFTASLIARFNQRATTQRLELLNHFLQYLKRT